MPPPSQKGFTLIELMIVVGVVGILVSIATPLYNLYQRRALQSEAKIALGASYALEQGFYTEYSAYAPALNAIGYAPEGSKRFYAVSACMDITGNVLYAGTITGYSGDFSGMYYDRINYPSSFAWTGYQAGNTCNGGLCAAQYPLGDPQNFGITAQGQLCKGCVRDVWQINQSKTLKNCSAGTN